MRWEVKKMNARMIGFMVLLLVVGTLAIPVIVPKVQDSTLTEDEIHWLTYMREEEKMARDVYLYLYSRWGLRIFQNIAASEQTHMNAIKTLLDRYGVPDPAAGKGLGRFNNSDLQSLYSKLILQGRVSRIAALKVGVFIEKTDIEDLKIGIATANHRDIKTVYSNLLQGSLNHLVSFRSVLAKFVG